MVEIVRGLVAAPFTPMHPDGSVNLDAVGPYADLLHRNGLAGAFICGTTGEGLSLTTQERLDLAGRWVGATAGRQGFKLIVHVGHTSLAECRILRQGERASRILAPITYRKRKERQQREGEAEQKDEDAGEVLAFKSAAVFDVSQTDGKPLAEFARVSGDPAEHLLRLKDLVSSRGIGLEYTSRIGPAQGASAGGKIILREDMEPAEEISTLVHELAHEALHQDKTERSKTVKETEAEAVAFVVCQSIGMECGTASSDYVQLYDGKKETLLASLERIRETTAEIIEPVLSKSEQRAESTAQQEALAAA